MKKVILIMFVIGTIFCSGCNKGAPSGIKGKWAVDLDRMVQKAREIGATDQDIQQVIALYKNGRLEIKDNLMHVSIAGMADKEDLPYTVISEQGGCSELEIKIQGQPTRGKFCINNGRLEVQRHSQKLIEIYRPE